MKLGGSVTVYPMVRTSCPVTGFAIVCEVLAITLAHRTWFMALQGLVRGVNMAISI